ncbi:MAG: hypothetical protein HRU12_07380 [Phaeodactylibacter sp.]|nr:hypothetical protein [Phaeodactylibacter sp.]
MKQHEIRVGNLVRHIKNGLVYRADHVTIQFAHLYEPIELNEEWLLKFGFVKYDIAKVNNNILLVWDKDCGLNAQYSEFDVDLLSKGIYTVHEMQNCFFEFKREELKIQEK